MPRYYFDMREGDERLDGPHECGRSPRESVAVRDESGILSGTISQIIPRRMKTPISTRTAVPSVATVRKASLGDRSIALAVLRSPKAQDGRYRGGQ
jgi:hypothetical protein